MLDIKITKTTAPKEKPKGNLGFGRIFTDHMFVMDYTQEWVGTTPHCALSGPHPVSRRHGVSLRPGDVRGPEGLQGGMMGPTTFSART